MYIHDIISMYVYASCLPSLQHYCLQGKPSHEATAPPKVQQAFSEPAMPPKRRVLQTLREERGSHESHERWG